MSDPCRIYRIEWLERCEHAVEVAGGPDRSHARSCADCRAWVRSTSAQMELLRGLRRRSAPDALAEHLERELAGDRTQRLARALGGLARLAAPAELGERVRSALALPLAQEERGQKNAQVLHALDVQQAPAVLDRLVDEELRAQELHRSERFAGDLERLSAPVALERRVRFGVRRRALVRLFVGPVATLAAAGLIVWLVARGGEEPRREYSFRVVHASDLVGLDPLARSLAGDLASAGSSGRGEDGG